MSGACCSPVVHHQQLQVRHVGNNELLEAGGQGVPGLLVGAEANIGHSKGALELAADTVINTLGPAPAGLDGDLPVALVAVEVLRPLLHNLHLLQWLHHFS